MLKELALNPKMDKMMKNPKNKQVVRFKRVYIEISNICNLSCHFCPPVKRTRKSMTSSEFEYIIKQIKPHSSFVYLHVKGEPLLHKELEQILDIADKYQIQINITTNATLLKQREELLLNSNALRQMNLSLHAFTKDSGIDHDNYVDTVLSFAKKTNDIGVYTVFRLWNLTQDDEMTKLGLDIMEKIEQTYTLENPLIESMGGHKSIKIASHTYVGWEREFVWPSLENDYVSNTGFCYGLRHQVAILVDGTVVPCCLDANGEARLGNIFEQDFSEIIETKLSKSIKHGFAERKVVHELCQKCSFRTKFD